MDSRNSVCGIKEKKFYTAQVILLIDSDLASMSNTIHLRGKHILDFKAKMFFSGVFKAQS